MKPISVSYVILTWNRKPSVDRSLTENLSNAGYPINELIHVDNGSEGFFCDWFAREFKPTVQIKHRRNEGVARGYNRGLALTTSSHVVIAGCDRVLPKNWLASWVNAFEKIPNTGVISCYIKKDGVESDTPSGNVNGINIKFCDPVHARMHSKDFLFKTGFWREDFGIYGYEDVEWSDRAKKTAKENNLINYMLTDLGRADYLTCEDFPLLVDGKPYWEFKRDIHADPRRKDLWQWCRQNGSPHYNPYARVELNYLDKENRPCMQPK